MMVSTATVLAVRANATVPAYVPATVNIVHGTHSQLIAFLVLNIWPSHFGIPILLAIVFFSKKVQRHATFVNLAITFIIAGISSSLLAYAGKTTGPEPSPVLCLLQASLLYGYPPMTSVAAFALVLHMFLVIRKSYYGEELLERNRIVLTWAMLISPYVAFFVGALSTAIVGAANPTEVSRNRRFFYCSVRSLPLTNTITVFAAVFLFATVFVEGWLIFMLCKRWRALRSKGLDMKGALDLSMPLRVLAYGSYSSIALSLSLISIKAPENPAPDLIIATASTVFLLIFATQRDILHVLCFWRRAKRSITKNIPVEIIVSRDQKQMSYYGSDLQPSRYPGPVAL
ncbi:hypothetical protein LshimejAT787_0102980 [Lyophyllum shimeji]|uniref:Uncharacterized protein n=1 Tax=Lyophyllum shimeji TaxID=47721 RepID=A0A9P3UH85_LYOSH|nr:hypothetical protein LshimejAT787_0102980 [Lyophyllum shimeji]